MDTTIGTYYSFLDDCLLSCLGCPTQPVPVPPDDGPRYARNM